ncbi:MAG TPA: cytochrome c oxidase assembly protein [Acidimicrobiales bacterium]|jgi:cytochrome c oxidase assembly factor CtaG|nr:cytochrome c oxidase assembly protein [Acidimicrobiales bacterium]
MQLPPYWQVTPIGVIAVVIGIGYEMGVRWLALRQNPEHRRVTRRRSWAFYAGLTGLVLVVSGPLDRWAMAWLSVHMVLHVLEMFYLPPLLIIGAPWVPLLFAIPVDQRRSLLHGYYHSPWTAMLRWTWAVLSNPIVAVILFNGVMVVWHLPAVYDWAATRDWVMNWLMAPSFLVVGLLFWRVILPSHPWGPRGSTRVQVGAIVVTAFEMLILAMAMAIFTKAPWYSMNVLMDGPVAALRDQRYAAGILWICGDFWAIPALVLVGYRIYGKDGGVSASLERALGRV